MGFNVKHYLSRADPDTSSKPVYKNNKWRDVNDENIVITSRSIEKRGIWRILLLKHVSAISSR